MLKVLAGTQHFCNFTFPVYGPWFADLARGQRPEVLFITCSDSRVVPSLFTQSHPGDLFVLRNAGNVVAPYDSPEGACAAATIEYALQALGTRHIVVCGHSRCGAVEAALRPESAKAMPAVQRWLRFVSTLPPDGHPNLAWENDRDAAVKANVLAQLENLRAHPAVADGLERGDVRLHGWVYRFEEGDVLTYDPRNGFFYSLRDDRHAHAFAEAVRTRATDPVDQAQFQPT
jgi:carbonic anhydrase